MYNTVVTIPRTAAADLARFKSAEVPLDVIANIPITETAAQAEALATKKLTATLADPSYKYEYIRSMDSVTLNEDGRSWAVSFTIAGD